MLVPVGPLVDAGVHLPDVVNAPDLQDLVQEGGLLQPGVFLSAVHPDAQAAESWSRAGERDGILSGELLARAQESQRAIVETQTGAVCPHHAEDFGVQEGVVQRPPAAHR